MSYCRWSSDDFRCDVYVYEHCDGGWTTHVATNRVVYDEPLPEPVDISDGDRWLSRHRKVMEMVNRAKRVPIGLPHDGKTFTDSTPGKAAETLRELRAIGYIVPEYAIEELEEEWREMVEAELERKPEPM